MGFITTDAAIDKALLLELQRELIEDTFNMVSVDGDTSTNDTVFVFANGMAEIKKLQKKMQTMKHSEKDYYMLTSLLQTDRRGWRRMYTFI